LFQDHPHLGYFSPLSSVISLHCYSTTVSLFGM
jgi:hypothetical protein